MEEPELVDNVAGKEYEGILVKEKPFILHVQMSSKAETKFGVKEFRNDIIKQYPKEKLECMVEALKGCGYSIKSITEKKNGKAESYKLSTEKLYQFGYLKRYVVDKMGEFFTLSPRGERAFVAKDSLSFINQNIKEKVSSQDDGEPIEDTANSSIVRLLSFDSSIKQRKLVPDYEFVIRMNVMATDYFVEGYPGKDSDITNWFAGIVTENVEQLQEFKETVNDKVNPGDVLIVTGNTLEQAETVANWLLSEFTLELRNIGYTTLFENSVYDIATKEPILFETKESIENDENLTAEPPILKEKKEKQQSEDETVSLEESENTGENKTIGKNGVAENESSSEETRLLKEIVIEAEETGGNRSYKATTKTVNSAVPSILEEEKKKYISTYQKMIVSGKTYAASAYLKALAKQHPYFEPFYRQLASAVNDPMEWCTYSSDTIFIVFYGDTVPISDYYIVAAALRNYFFDQYSYDYSIQQLLRMARKDIDHDENGDRAILVDIKGNDYKAAAKKISAALFDEGILKEEHITDDWSELARDIKKCLRSSTDYIPYLLLLMDEADVFIESCESVGYRPFDALKDIQSIGSGRFKFVVAGLRNIVRFKREVALGNNSVLTHLESLTVKPFKSMEARELLEVALSYLGFRFPKDNDTEVLISTIFGTTNYFPGLLQLYCAKLIEAMRRDYAGYSESETPPYIVKKDHIKKVLAEQSLQQDIREKFFITLKVGEDDYYYIIALLVAYYYHGNKSQNGCSASDLIELADTYSIGKISAINSESLAALMEEMCELNVLQHTGDGRYRFTRHSFCQMMGTVQQIEDELMNYMED